jgi:hypothetical protein
MTEEAGSQKVPHRHGRRVPIGKNEDNPEIPQEFSKRHYFDQFVRVGSKENGHSRVSQRLAKSQRERLDIPATLNIFRRNYRFYDPLQPFSGEVFYGIKENIHSLWFLAW